MHMFLNILKFRLLFLRTMCGAITFMLHNSASFQARIYLIVGFMVSAFLTDALADKAPVVHEEERNSKSAKAIELREKADISIRAHIVKGQLDQAELIVVSEAKESRSRNLGADEADECINIASRLIMLAGDARNEGQHEKAVALYRRAERHFARAEKILAKDTSDPKRARALARERRVHAQMLGSSADQVAADQSLLAINSDAPELMP
jgi:hypothetical protein